MDPYRTERSPFHIVPPSVEEILEARPRSPSGVRQIKREVEPRPEEPRPLDSWERYRALSDATTEAYQVNDMCSREARFAFLLMGSLNACVLIGVSRADLLSVLDGHQRLWAVALLGIYALSAVYFILQAIEALRPGKFRPRLGDWREDSDDFPKGVRYYEDVIERDVESHWKAWREVRIEQLNAELAIQIHSQCVKTQSKRAALRRLYAGLRVMTLLLAGLLLLFVYSTWM